MTPLPSVISKNSPSIIEITLNLDTKHFCDSLNRFQSDAMPPAGFDVLKVPRPKADLFGRRLLAPATCEADLADIGA